MQSALILRKNFEAGRWVYPAALLIASFVLLDGYTPWRQPVFLLSLATAAVHIHPGGKRHSLFLAVAAFVFLFLSLLVPVKTLLFLSLLFVAAYWIERRIGAMGSAGLAALFLASPIFDFVANIAGFSVRLWMTQCLAFFFSFWQKEVHAEGNLIVLPVGQFSVDPACMGMKMLTVSLVLSLLLLGMLQKKAKKEITFRWLIFFLFLIVCLNLLANFIRMSVLVQFLILQENPLHDAVGLLCLLLYVCLPAAFLARWLVQRKAKAIPKKSLPSTGRSLALPWLLFTGLIVSGCRIKTTDTYSGFSGPGQKNVAGFRTTAFAPGILKLEHANCLVYVKYLRGFYDTEHHPSLCWKGSGYRLEKIRSLEVSGSPVYMAELQGPSGTLHTAWWYENGQRDVISQWQWRKDMFLGSPPYALVNLTAGSPEEVIQEVHRLRQERSLHPLFSKGSHHKPVHPAIIYPDQSLVINP